MANKAKRSRIIWQLVTILLILALFALMCFNRSNPDYTNYWNFYWDKDDFAKRQHELGFFWLTRIGRLAGISYETFFTGITGLALAVLLAWFYWLMPLPTLAIGAYALFPFLLDIVQLRNFLAMVIGLWAFTLLMGRKKDPGYRWLSLALILLAGTIHNTAFIGLAFWVVLQWPLVWVILGAGLGFSASFLLPRLVTEASLAQSSSHVLQRYAYLFRGQVSLMGRIFFVGLALALLLAVYWIRHLVDQESLEAISVRKSWYLQLEELTQKLAFLHFGLMPLFFQSVDFFRIFRNFLPFYWGLFAIAWQVPALNKRQRLEKVILSLLMLGIVLGTCYVLLLFSNTDNVVRAIFKENLLLRWFQG